MIQETDEITYAWNRSRLARVPPGELILVTDFDGTLAEIVQDPAAAGARPEALDALQELVPLLADVIVLSSRPPAQLERLVPVSGVRLIGDSGLAIPRTAQKEALDRFNADARRLLEPIAGSWLEGKPASIAIHFRNTAKTGEQMLALLRSLLDGARLRPGEPSRRPGPGRVRALLALVLPVVADPWRDAACAHGVSRAILHALSLLRRDGEPFIRRRRERVAVERADRVHVFARLCML